MFWLWQVRIIFLPPANEVSEGCFHRCLSVDRGVSASGSGGGLCLGRHPPWTDIPLPSACWDAHTPAADTTGYGQQADGTHPLECILVSLSLSLLIQTKLNVQYFKRKTFYSLHLPFYSPSHAVHFQ